MDHTKKNHGKAKESFEIPHTILAKNCAFKLYFAQGLQHFFERGPNASAFILNFPKRFCF
jgi:hypothetical protein